MDNEEIPICKLCRKTYLQQCCCWIQLSIGSAIMIFALMIGLIIFQTNLEYVEFIPGCIYFLGLIVTSTSQHRVPKYLNDSEIQLYD